MIYVVNYQFKIPEQSLAINTTSRSTDWGRSFSPFFLGPINLYSSYISQNMENAWQYSKVYEYYTTNGEPNSDYFNWAQLGWNSKFANRYPMGKNVKPLYSYWNGQKLNYIQSRKTIYIPLYSNAIKNTPAFSKLQKLHKTNTLYLIDFDAHNLVPGSFNYDDLVNNPNLKMGHAYVLAMMLEGYL